MHVTKLTSPIRRSLEERLRYVSGERIPELEAAAIESEDEDRHTLFGLLESARREQDEIAKLLAAAHPHDEEAFDPTVIEVGDTVRVKAIDEQSDDTYTIVPPGVDARLGDSWISATSPLGSALLGSARGDTVGVSAPSGTVGFIVVDHRRDH
ncbi:MAG: GreA/GreB family elongation factor [Actinomycetota bacterium]